MIDILVLILFDKQILKAMKNMYPSPNDVDLYAGGISEQAGRDGAKIGNTFKHMIAQQFARIKQADRHFYEMADQESSFTLGQLPCRFNITIH